MSYFYCEEKLTVIINTKHLATNVFLKKYFNFVVIKLQVTPVMKPEWWDFNLPSYSFRFWFSSGLQRTVNYRVDDAGGQFHFENRDVIGRGFGCYGQRSDSRFVLIRIFRSKKKSTSKLRSKCVSYFLNCI